MNTTLIMMMILSSISFLFMKTPLTSGMLLLSQTLIITLISGMLSFSYWYSYILFLILVGGLLILFTYTTSLAPNQKYNKIYKFDLIKFLLLSMLMFFFINYYFLMEFKYEYSPSLDMFNFNMISFEEEKITMFFLKFSLNKIFNNSTKWILLILINYLLMTLFISVELAEVKKGPLRVNNLNKNKK